MSQTTQKLFGVYVQATKDGARRQYIVLPPVTPEVNGFRLLTEDAPRNATILTRKQHNASHRATWSREVAPAIDTTYATTLANWVTRSISAGWEVSPLIIVELHPSEMKAIIEREKEAHHKLLERFTRVAARKHSLVI